MKLRRAQSTIRWVIIAAATLAAAVVAYLMYAAARPTVTVSEATVARAEQAFYATGTIQPKREFYVIRAAAAGYLRRSEGATEFVDKGDVVTKDRVLACVMSDAHLIELTKAAAELTEKQARAAEDGPVLAEYDAVIASTTKSLEYARNELNRTRELRKSNNASITDVERADTRVQNLEGELASLRSKRASSKLLLARELEVAQKLRDIAQWNFDQQLLKSPVDGVVLDRPVSEGTYVAVNDPIMQVADVKPENLVMRASVDEEDIARVEVGKPVTMVLYSLPGEPPLEGKVKQIYPKADAERRTFEVDVQLDKPDDRLRPGMTGELAFQTAAKEKALVVPSQAVQDGKLYVVRDGRVKAIHAKIGIRGIAMTEVLDGIQPGDRVIISPVGEIKEGQSVRTSYVDFLAAARQNKPAAREVGKFGF